MSSETEYFGGFSLKEYLFSLKQRWAHLVALFLAYFLVAKIDQIIFKDIQAAPAVIWPGAGIAVAGLYLGGLGIWPAVLLASFSINYSNGTSFWLALVFGTGNALQSALGAYLLNSFGFDKKLDRLWDILVLFMTSFFATIISPSIGLAGIQILSGIEATAQRWVSWWLGGVLSITVLTPLVTSWFDKVSLPSQRKVIELFLAFSSLLGVNFILFFTQYQSVAGIPLVYTILLPLFWICLRFKPKYVVTAVFITTVMAIGGIIRGYNNGLEDDAGTELMSVEVFTIIISMIFYLLSAIYAERKTAESNLKSYVQQLEQALETIRQHALHDILTGLPNRKAMEERFGVTKSIAQRHNHKVAMLFLDLDQFKNINDTLGHSIGDLVLKEVSSRLTESIRQVDTVSRLGGDEFIIILSEIQTVDDIENVARKVLNAFNAPIYIDDNEIQTSTSIGIAVYPDAGENIHDLLRSADIALYRAKDKGRNQFQFYDQEMKKQLHAKLTLEQELKHAIENQQLRLVYQPYVNLKTERIKGVEALIRWNHPELGLLSPKDFIPLAEDTGLINQIGLWVLNRACKQIKQWKKLGIVLPVSINLSAKQFFGNNLVESVAKTLEKYELSPKDLDLEITESVAMQTLYAGDQLEQLVKMGVSLSMDDFGTGYSSLGNIKSLFINRLKIDKAFIKNLLTDAQDEAIVRTIISMGHTLGMRVCAEGIEKFEEKELLRTMGCDSGQGYYFYKPLDGLEIIKVIEKERVQPMKRF